MVLTLGRHHWVDSIDAQMLGRLHLPVEATQFQFCLQHHLLVFQSSEFKSHTIYTPTHPTTTAATPTAMGMNAATLTAPPEYLSDDDTPVALGTVLLYLDAVIEVFTFLYLVSS